MIRKLRNIFFNSDHDIIAAGDDPLSNKMLSFDDFAKNRGYFTDKSRGLGFKFSGNGYNYSKADRRFKFVLLLVFVAFYPLIGLQALYYRQDMYWRDVLRAIIYYVPLCFGIMVISVFGLFCPLRAVTLVYSLEHRLLGKVYLPCMNPLIFEGGEVLFSAGHARVAGLRQRICINILLLAVLCLVRFSPAFVWLKQKALLYLALSVGAQNMLVFISYFAFSAAIFAAALFLCGTIQSSSLTPYTAYKSDSMLMRHIGLHISLLVMVCVYLAIMIYGGVVIANPVLLANVISGMSVGATLLLHYWSSKSDAHNLVRLIFLGEYALSSEFNNKALGCSSVNSHKMNKYIKAQGFKKDTAFMPSKRSVPSGFSACLAHN